MEQVKIQRLGDGRIEIDGVIYLNEESSRVLSIEEERECRKQKKRYNIIVKQKRELEEEVGRLVDKYLPSIIPSHTG